MSSQFQDKVLKINTIPLKSIIEEFGGTFVSSKNFYHPTFGYEKTPAGFIYERNGREYWKHFKHDKSGDAIDFVMEVCGITNKIEAINKILGEDKSFKTISKADEIKNKERIEKEEKERRVKEKKRMYAILKNSVQLLDSDIGIEYFVKRGLDTAITFKNSNMNILVNSFKDKDNKVINNIVYHFKGDSSKGTDDFMIVKGIDEHANKNGLKLNIRTCRPFLHCGEYNKPFIVCEGLEDALSALETKSYKNFISLNSISSTNKLILNMNTCRKWFSNNSLELCLDNDEAGISSTNKIKVFSNLVSLYENNELTSLKEFLNKKSTLNDETKGKCMYTLKMLHETTDLKGANSNIVLTLVKNLTEILPQDYFKDYGKFYKIKESEYFHMLKKLGRSDLNEMLVKDLKGSLDCIISKVQKDVYCPMINSLVLER